jgi:hypothetical protein
VVVADGDCPGIEKMDEALKNLYQQVLETILAHRRGHLSWREMIMRFPSNEDYEDEDLSELVDLTEHEPGAGFFPSAKKDRQQWEERTRRLMEQMASNAGLDPLDDDELRHLLKAR